MSTHLHDHPFKFYRVRGGQETRICPHAGARLHFGSREADSLSLPTLPVGTLAAGDKVKVTYLEETVFFGTVEKRVRRKTGGSEQTETVTVLGPWSKMARLVYRQNWASWVKPDAGTDPYLGTKYSSRLILNETQQGLPQNLNSELAEIANHAAHACGYAVGDIDVSTQCLPSDECRDITVSDAIRRELRLYPKAVARFDYSGATPTLVIGRGSAASYDVADKTEREIEYDEHPITGVDLEIETTGTIDGNEYRDISHQTAGDTTAGNPDCLYATLQIRGASANATYQTFESVTEEIPANLNDVTWWKQKHPRLANVAPAAIKSITEGTRTPSAYPRISAATAGELEEAGINCEVSKFTCKVTIETTDEKEENVFLTAHFLTTDAEGTKEHPKTYRWLAESSTESGESVPAGLAAAILAERCGSIRSEKMTIRLGETFPAIGDTITDEDQALPLQSFDVDCADLTAELTFGAPEYLSPEDMASLLSNFRNKRTTSSSTIRKSGKTGDAGANVELGGIPPLSSTEFEPGGKAKTTIRSSFGSGGSISLDSSELASGEKASMKKVTGGGQGDAKIVSTKPIAVIGGKGIEVTANGGTIKVTANPDKQDEDPDPYGGGGGGGGSGDGQGDGDPCDHPGNSETGNAWGAGGGLGPVPLKDQGDTGGGGGCGSGCGGQSTTGGSGTGSPEPGADGKPAEGATGGGASAPGKEVTTPPSSGSSGTASGSPGKEIRPGSMEATVANTKTPIYTGTHKALTDTKKMNQSPFKADANWHGSMEDTVANTKKPIYTGTHAALTDTKKMNESPFKKAGK